MHDSACRGVLARIDHLPRFHGISAAVIPLPPRSLRRGGAATAEAVIGAATLRDHCAEPRWGATEFRYLVRLGRDDRFRQRNERPVELHPAKRWWRCGSCTGRVAYGEAGWTRWGTRVDPVVKVSRQDDGNQQQDRKREDLHATP